MPRLRSTARLRHADVVRLTAYAHIIAFTLCANIRQRLLFVRLVPRPHKHNYVQSCLRGLFASGVVLVACPSVPSALALARSGVCPRVPSALHHHTPRLTFCCRSPYALEGYHTLAPCVKGKRLSLRLPWHRHPRAWLKALKGELYALQNFLYFTIVEKIVKRVLRQKIISRGSASTDFFLSW